MRDAQWPISSYTSETAQNSVASVLIGAVFLSRSIVCVYSGRVRCMHLAGMLSRRDSLRPICWQHFCFFSEVDLEVQSGSSTLRTWWPTSALAT